MGRLEHREVLMALRKTIPRAFRAEIEKAILILKNAGCRRIYLFGSLASGTHHAGSDIDIAVEGLARSRYFAVLGKLLMELDHPVDLVLLDDRERFSVHLRETEQLLEVA
jgi:predicted nucleotidyltransferase